MKLPLILLLLFACSSDRKVEIEFSVDSTGRLSGPPHERLDSAVYYFIQLAEYKMKRDSNEIAYLKTGDEKYFHRGNECVGIGHEYYLKLHRVTKNIKPR